MIEDTFISKQKKEDFSILVSSEDIVKKNYSFSAGQYFEVKIEYVPLTEKEFNQKIAGAKDELNKFFEKSKEESDEIINSLEKISL